MHWCRSAFCGGCMTCDNRQGFQLHLIPTQQFPDDCNRCNRCSSPAQHLAQNRCTSHSPCTLSDVPQNSQIADAVELIFMILVLLSGRSKDLGFWCGACFDHNPHALQTVSSLQDLFASRAVPCRPDCYFDLWQNKFWRCESGLVSRTLSPPKKFRGVEQ